MTRTGTYIAYFMALSLVAVSGQQVFNFQQYPSAYHQPQAAQQQYLIPQQAQQQHQQQQYQQAQFAVQPEKVTGYNPEDVIPAVESPLKNLDKSQTNRNYVDFINQLYRFDRTKPALHFEKHRRSVSPDPLQDEEASHSRQKRAIIFRPMFVYRQQQVRKERVQSEKAAEAKAAAAPKTVSANQGQLYKDKQNHVYREYNSFYEPYRYGQRFPYRSY